MDPAGDDVEGLRERQLSYDNPALTVPVSAHLPPPARVLSSLRTASTGKEGDELQRAITNRYNKGWRRIIRNFTPSWFAVTMGTGVVGVLLDTIPFKAHWLYHLSIVFFILNTIIFFAALLVSILRYAIWPEIWGVMIQSDNALFLGTFPMGFATLVQLWVLICVPPWGEWAIKFAWVLWMIDTVVAVLVAVSLPVMLMSSNPVNSLDRITAAQLLPIVAPIVAAGTGARVAEVLPNLQESLGTVIVCYVLWGMAVPLAVLVLVIYYQRLAVHKLPPREVIVSCFLPLGPLGFGGFTIMYLGQVARTVFPATHFVDPLGGTVAYIVGLLVALVMWGFGLMWLAFALCTIYLSRPFPFNMGWWGFVFPLGVFSASTLQLGKEMPSLFFRVLGTVFSTAVVVVWIVVAAGTIKEAWSGKIFYAPCLLNLPATKGKEGDGTKAE